ncbi:MAG: hypothetical protein CMN75_13700, partial [Spirochaeta sp.]
MQYRGDRLECWGSVDTKGSLLFIRLAFALLMFSFSCSSGTDVPRPNVLLVVLDTTRFDALSVYNPIKRTTPHLERVAREGVR